MTRYNSIKKELDLECGIRLERCLRMYKAELGCTHKEACDEVAAIWDNAIAALPAKNALDVLALTAYAIHALKITWVKRN